MGENVGMSVGMYPTTKHQQDTRNNSSVCGPGLFSLAKFANVFSRTLTKGRHTRKSFAATA